MCVFHAQIIHLLPVQFSCFLVLKNSGVSCCFVMWCGHCSASFHSFVLRHLVIAPVCNTKKLPRFVYIGLYFDQSEGRTGKNMVLKLPLSLEDLFCQANKILVISSPDTKLPYSVKSHSGFYGKHRQRYCCESSANSRD